MAEERSFPKVLSRLLLPAGVVFIVALHAVLWWLEVPPATRGLIGDEAHYQRVAQHWVAGEEPPLVLLWPPLYGGFVAAVAFLAPLPWILWIAQTLLLVLAAWLLARIARAFDADHRTTLLIGAMVLAYPPLVGFAHYLWPEVLHLVLWLGALWIVLTRRHAMGWAAALGAVLGLALLTKSLLTPFVPVLLLPLVLGAESRRRRMLRLALAVVVLISTVAPTVLSNYRQTGLWVIANSATFNLWVGLNDRSHKNLIDPVVGDEYASYMKSADSWAERDRILRRKIGDFFSQRKLSTILRAQVSRQYFRLFDKDSYLTDQLPGGALHGPGRGYQQTPPWLARWIRWLSYASYAALLVMASWGFWVRPPPAGRGAWLLVVFLLYNLGLLFWLHVKSRFRIQLLPVFFLYAGFAMEGWWLRRPTVAGRWRVLAAVVTGGLLLGLAFGGR